MTTFTMQDLTINNLPTTTEEDEAMKELFEKMGQDLTAQHAPVPQPTQMGEPLPKSQVSPEAVIDEMLYTIKQSLLLLATVIKQQPNTTPPEGNPPSLQETIELTLQQAGWFKDMVAQHVEERVEYEVDSYFEHRFDPTDHFDFGDAISNEVHDRIDDAVRDQLDDKLEEVVAEKLESASVSISF
jgi:hypothetical protein